VAQHAVSMCRPDESPALLKTSEAAQMLGVARSTLLSWAYRGFLDYTTTPGGQRRFYRAQIEELQAKGWPEKPTPSR
jgi:excisionase family DNA binding protein